MNREDTLRATYEAFNRRDIDGVLAQMADDVDWPNGWEGGRVAGRHAVREYWTRQFEELDPSVVPTRITELADGRIEVEVDQVVRDRGGTILAQGTVRHLYTFDGDLVQRMEIAE